MAHVGQAHLPMWKIDGVQANTHSTNSSIALLSHVGIGRFIRQRKSKQFAIHVLQNTFLKVLKSSLRTTCEAVFEPT